MRWSERVAVEREMCTMVEKCTCIDEILYDWRSKIYHLYAFNTYLALSLSQLASGREDKLIQLR